jgi:predicted nucleic acid-binding protein
MLLDTSGLLCAHHVGEPAHSDARGLIVATPRLVIHNSVLAELVALAEARRLSRLPALAFLTEQSVAYESEESPLLQQKG